MSAMKDFFAPRSIAIVGASATAGKPGNTVIANLRDNGFRGSIHPVNPGGGEILGLKVCPMIADLPDGVDMAIVILPAKANPGAIRECGARGIRSVVLVAGGFAEVDDAGGELQADLVEAIRETGIRVLGPNTAGHISTPDDFTSSFFPLGRIPRGNVSYIAQTGNFTGAMMRHIMSAERYGVARCIGLGNNVDIDECDLVEFLADDDQTKAIFLYMEALHRPARFIEVASRASRLKPVIMLKGGSTPEGARAAMSHTASMGADDRILDGALRQAGVVRIREFSQLFSVARAVSAGPLPRGNRVGFVSPSGAFIVHLSDVCREQLDIEFARIAPQTLARLKEISPPFISITNPVDVFPSATVHGMEFAYREAMKAVIEDPNVDAVVAILILTDETGVPPLDFIVELAAQHPDKPVHISFSGDKACNEAAADFLEPRGVPTFPMIDEPFRVLDILTRCSAALTRP